jgi:selenide,water dikinase
VRDAVCFADTRHGCAVPTESRKIDAMNSPQASFAPIRLTSFSHGGGCGCKIAPGILSEILRGSRGLPVPKELMVGIETSDDAAVYRLNDQQALIATHRLFHAHRRRSARFRSHCRHQRDQRRVCHGRYADHGTGAGWHADRQAAGGNHRAHPRRRGECLRCAGIPIAGGHTIDSVEPIYGLVALGLVHPEQVKTNAGARPGDVLILGKGLGVGVLSAALKKGALDADGYAAMIASTTKLNTPGRKLAPLDAVHALTDVTGFGLLGHLLEICRGSAPDRAPGDGAASRLLADVARLAGASATSRAHRRATGWATAPRSISRRGISEMQRALLTDPQTSGGLLVACAPEAIGCRAGTLPQRGL